MTAQVVINWKYRNITIYSLIAKSYVPRLVRGIQ